MTRARILADYVSSGDELALKAPITNAALVTPNLGTPSAGVMTNMTGAVEASLVDNAVTLAKMAGGTDGNLITYDTSGDPAYVATGTSGHVLTSAGADAVPTFQAAGGGEIVQVRTMFAPTDYSAYPHTTTTGTGVSTSIADTITFTEGNRILAICLANAEIYGGGDDSGGWLFLHDGSNQIGQTTHLYSFGTTPDQSEVSTITRLFSPSGTSVTVTLKISGDNGGTIKNQNIYSSLLLIEVAA